MPTLLMQAAPQRKKHDCRSLPAFSLVELLAVIAIVTVLMAVAVPVFSDPANSARQVSREMVKAQLQRARAQAIASGSPTAVAVPVLASGGELGIRAITLFKVAKNGAKYEPVKDENGVEQQLQRWETLPGNFHIIPASLISSPKPTIVDSAETLLTNYKGRAVTCHLIVFAPNGQIVLPSSETNIAIARAARSGDSLSLTRTADGKPVFEFLQVNRLTGRIRSIQP